MATTSWLHSVVFGQRINCAAHLQGHLDEARSMSAQLPQAARPLMLPAIAAGLYLDALEMRNFDVFATELQASGGFSPLWHNLVTKYKLLRHSF